MRFRIPAAEPPMETKCERCGQTLVQAAQTADFIRVVPLETNEPVTYFHRKCVTQLEN